MNATEVAARYQQPGKKAVRKFVVDLAVASGCQTALDFWGGGTSARDFARAGLSVVSAEMDRSLWSELDRDAEANGYVAHHGRASRVEGVFDMVWADFCGMVSGEMERELKTLVPHVNKFLAVTLMPERESDEFLIRAREATIPAWLVATTGLALLYIKRYFRSPRGGHEMWFAVLGEGNSPGRPIDPCSLTRHLRFPTRRYWASKALYKKYPALFPYRSSIHFERPYPVGRCAYCGNDFQGLRVTRKYCDTRCQTAAAHKRRRARRDGVDYHRRCLACGRRYVAHRSDQQWCSNRCYPKVVNARRRKGLGARESQPKPALPIAA